MGHPRRRPQIARCWFITSLSRIYSNNDTFLLMIINDNNNNNKNNNKYKQ